MVVETLNEEMIWSWLDEIPDPEITFSAILYLVCMQLLAVSTHDRTVSTYPSIQQDTELYSFVHAELY